MDCGRAAMITKRAKKCAQLRDAEMKEPPARNPTPYVSTIHTLSRLTHSSSASTGITWSTRHAAAQRNRSSLCSFVRVFRSGKY
uniref:Uncharacterized protein n=1 Tax=Caenorhabditis japonica TaxID=281687 RepID=A0A8R1ESH1_CAEJA